MQHPDTKAFSFLAMGVQSGCAAYPHFAAATEGSLGGFRNTFFIVAQTLWNCVKYSWNKDGQIHESIVNLPVDHLMWKPLFCFGKDCPVFSTGQS